MDALSQGTKDGLSLAINVGAMLLVLISFVALANILLSNIVIDGQSFSIEQILGWCFAPIAWLIGIPWSEAIPAGALLGTKLVLNELVAFIQLAQNSELFSPQSRLILLYALCGFANIGSLGIRQISLTCKALLSLNIANTLIVDSSLSDIGEGLIQLEELLMDNCVLITDDGK